ncbi:MAG: hypothetical protein O2897_04140, partial [bacterium]|nr:hypothetical protein [bacterium]
MNKRMFFMFLVVSNLSLYAVAVPVANSTEEERELLIGEASTSENLSSSEVLTGNKVDGYCDPKNFSVAYLGTALGIPISAVLIGFVARVANARAAELLVLTSALVLGVSAIVQMGMSMAYIGKCQ